MKFLFKVMHIIHCNQVEVYKESRRKWIKWFQYNMAVKKRRLWNRRRIMRHAFRVNRRNDRDGVPRQYPHPGIAVAWGPNNELLHVYVAGHRIWGDHAAETIDIADEMRYLQSQLLGQKLLPGVRHAHYQLTSPYRIHQGVSTGLDEHAEELDEMFGPGNFISWTPHPEDNVPMSTNNGIDTWWVGDPRDKPDPTKGWSEIPKEHHYAIAETEMFMWFRKGRGNYPSSLVPQWFD